MAGTAVVVGHPDRVGSWVEVDLQVEVGEAVAEVDSLVEAVALAEEEAAEAGKIRTLNYQNTFARIWFQGTGI